jgi:hypothetical protein
MTKLHTCTGVETVSCKTLLTPAASLPLPGLTFGLLMTGSQIFLRKPTITTTGIFRLAVFALVPVAKLYKSQQIIIKTINLLTVVERVCVVWEG